MSTEIQSSVRQTPWWYKEGDGNDGFTYEHTDSVTVDGITYTRCSWGHGRPAEPPTGHFRASRGTPGVICGNPRCLGALFVLSYGDYELKAKCAVCGLEDVVYDG